MRCMLPSIEISLQNHLSRNLIDVMTCRARLFAGFTQRPVRCDCR
jgi:hypothetical protein